MCLGRRHALWLCRFRIDLAERAASKIPPLPKGGWGDLAKGSVHGL